MATDRAQFGGRKPRVNVVYHRPCLVCDMMQHLHKRAKAQVRDFAAPQGFHALHVERLQGDMIVLCTEFMGQIPVERLPYMRNALMHTGQVLLRASAVVRTVVFA